MEPESKSMEVSLWLLQVIASLTDCLILSPLPMSRNSTLRGNCSHASHSSHLRYTLPTNDRLADSHRRIRGFPLLTHKYSQEIEGEKGGRREKVNMNLYLLSSSFFLENLSIEAFHLTL